MFGNVDLKRVIDTSSDLPPTTINLVGDAEFAFGFNVGLYWVISEKWQLGASYRSKVDATLSGGDVTFDNVPSSLSSFLRDNKFSSTIPLPSSANLALNWTPDENWEVGVEVNYIGWSAYKSLDFDFEDENPVIQDSESPRNYQDSWVFHLGGEYDFGKFQLRAGGYYDLTPVQEGYMTPETPDADRIAFTGGIGYSLGDFLQFDLAFLFIAGQEREQLTSVAQSVGTYPSSTNNTYAVEPGTYKMRAYIPGVTITYKF
jgi:long-chain fatty acid transport protein